MAPQVSTGHAQVEMLNDVAEEEQREIALCTLPGSIYSEAFFKQFNGHRHISLRGPKNSHGFILCLLCLNERTVCVSAV